MLPTKFWAEMKWTDFSAADMTKVVAVLPVAAIEPPNTKMNAS